MLFMIWSVVLLAVVVLYFRRAYSLFKKRGVRTPTVVPPVGSMATALLMREHFAESLHRIYKSFPGEKFVGMYEFTKPVLMIRDLDLIKKITIKDFEHFLDHRPFFTEASDSVFGRNLFALKGQEWKEMRSTLSPAFTSSKIRAMIPFMVEVGDSMVFNLKKTIQASESEDLEVDVKDLTTRFANDVIASCAFGLKVDSHEDKDNEFFVQGRDAFNFSFTKFFVIFLLAACPKLMKIVNVPIFSEKTKNFFRRLVLGTMQDRETRNIIRPDMIHLLMEAKKGKLSHDEQTTKDTDAGFATVEESTVGKKNITRVWSDDDLVAQALLFFLAGFETVSSAMSILLYELAVNPDVQDKLAKEIRETDAENGGKLDYNSIQQMVYMDMVVSEVLRKYPPAIAMDRFCLKDCNLGRPNKDATEDYIIRKGEGLQIPSWAIHRDPEYFPDPMKFDPERFSEENKHSIHPFAYMPFGLGPRNCIGSRFALCEVKVLAYQLMKHVEVSPGPKTTIPAEIDMKSINLRLKGGNLLKFKALSYVN